MFRWLSLMSWMCSVSRTSDRRYGSKSSALQSVSGGKSWQLLLALAMKGQRYPYQWIVGQCPTPRVLVPRGNFEDHVSRIWALPSSWRTIYRRIIWSSLRACMDIMLRADVRPYGSKFSSLRSSHLLYLLRAIEAEGIGRY